MRVKHFFMTGLLSMMAFVACKTDDIKPEIALEGGWEGEYSIESGPYDNYYSFIFKAGGILERQDILGQKMGEGTWVFSNENTVVSGTYHLLAAPTSIFSFVANFDSIAGELDGTWGYGEQEYGGGYWYMSKFN